MKSIKYFALPLLFLTLYSCKKFVDVDPPTTQLVGASVFSDNSTAASAVTGIYETMVRNTIGGNTNGISALLGLSADEFKLFPTSNVILNQTYSNSLLSTTNINIWSNLYNCIYQANTAIQGLAVSSKISEATKNQLLGESKFIRAFCHFYLTNIYGDIPIVLTTDYNSNQLISKSTQQDVYQQIIEDLLQSQSLLSDNYLTPTGSIANTRVRPNRSTATALLARIYLYQKKYDSAEMQASAVIISPNYKLSSDLNTVFLAANNKEAIWQLEPPNNGLNAPDGAFLAGYFSTAGPSSTNPFTLSDTLVNSFEPGDLRKSNWTVSKTFRNIKYNFPYKYKLNKNTGLPPVEYPVLFRLAEIYLIRSEARLQQDNLEGSKKDLDMIRTRAGLTGTTASTKQELFSAIFRERQLEFFTEYGHRWFDLKRTEAINSVMNFFTPVKGGAWETTDQLYPIPISNIQTNPNLIQNDGY